MGKSGESQVGAPAPQGTRAMMLSPLW